MEKIARLLIVGGVHGDEPFGLRLVKRIKDVRPEGVEGVVANMKALKKGVRYLETDMNRSFAVEAPVSIEERRAEELMPKLMASDAVIDVHSTRAQGTTCAITVCEPNKLHLKIARHLNMKRLVIMPPSGSLVATCPDKAISLEIATDKLGVFSTIFLLERLKTLNDVGDYDNRVLMVYKFVNRVSRKTLERMKIDMGEIANFKKLSTITVSKLGLNMSSEFVPIFYKRDEREDMAFTLVKKVGVIKDVK